MSAPPISRMVLSLLLVMLLAFVSACGGGDDSGNGEGGGGADSEPVTLRLANGLPASDQATRNWVEPFIEKAEETCDDLTIEHFPDAQLGDWEDAVNILQNSVADLSVVAPPYASGQMPLSSALNLPRLGSYEARTQAYYDLMMDESSAIHQTDFARNDIVPLASGATPLYELVTVDEPIEGPDALEGLLVRSTGGALDVAVRSLGGEPVAVTAGEQYQALERGTVDGGVFNYIALLSSSLEEVTKHGTLGAGIGSFNFAMAIPSDKWDELSQCAKDALTEAGRHVTDARVETVLAEEEEILQELRDSGFTFYEFSEAERKELDRMLAPVADRWVEETSGEGFDAAQALEEAQAALERHANG